ncbi:MAG: fasciclin domain-containing protein [Oceanipulchritudo sp.]
MKNRIIALSSIAVASLIAAPVIHADGHEEAPTIVEIALGNENFTTLVQAVSKAGLVDALNGKRQFTVFAPTNDAFDAAAAAVLGDGATGPELVDALDVATLTDILLYHVAPGERFSEDVVGAERVRTMNKSFLFVDAESLSLLGIGSEAGLVLDLIDIDASNGVVHVIDFVLLPFMLEE